MTTTEALITERLDDLREDSPGSTACTVAYLLGGASEHLMDEGEGTAASGAERAAENVGQAIAILTRYKAQLEDLTEALSVEAIEAAGYVSDSKGGWTKPEQAA